MSANTARRIVIGLNLVGPLVLVPVMFVLASQLGALVGFTLTLSILAGGVLVVWGLSLYGRKKERDEVDAGYTTLRRPHVHLDRISSRAGMVIRLGAPKVAVPRDGKHIPVGVGEPLETEAPRGILLHRRSFMDAVAAALQTRLPTAKVWQMYDSAHELEAACLALGPLGADRVRLRPRRGFVTLDDRELTFWSRTGARWFPVLAVPRSRVRSVSNGSTTDVTGHGVATTNMELVADDGTVVSAAFTVLPPGFATRFQVNRSNEEAVAWIAKWCAAR
ncbi:MAG: hypothetical protein EPN91_12315 [Salinibacterium sp.]|nr:MAG: hypothetical protein EPN91_12315 [Salinibacterium sp.]